MIALYPLAAFLAAFLLFLVQPLMARQILPWFGGAASVWSTCLVFFQVSLVAGYAYAHVTRRLGLRRQVVLHGALLCAAALMLPIDATADWQPASADAPAIRVLGLLVGIVGAPYVLLAATAPLLQDWHAQASPDRTPYRLYVYSNVGSIAGLLVYPFILEPFYPTSVQTVAWSAGYVVLLVACIACGGLAIVRTRGPATAVAPVGTAPALSRADRLFWFLLSASGSGLLLAITNRMCQDVASIPLLWIVPLSLYLVTFILCFAGVYRRSVCVTAFAIALALVGGALILGSAVPIWLQIVALGALLFSACMVYHGELVRLRPSSAGLTTFYFVLSAGGAAGGIFVALLAPLIFRSYAELPLLVALSIVLVVMVVATERARTLSTRVRPPLVAAASAALSVAVFVIVSGTGTRAGDLAAHRNFYGILRVVEDSPGTQPRLRGLYHGRILHGAEILDRAPPPPATTYYGEGSGVDLAIRNHTRRREGMPLTIGAIGLGAGTVAAWGAAGDEMRFFELDPDVVTLARQYFSFLRASSARVDVVVGDGRLSLEREMQDDTRRGRYDVLVVDAFSGDAIPVHLLTREAAALYRQALASDGVLAIHISNLYLDLAPVVRGLGAAAGLDAVSISRRGDAAAGTMLSEWMLLSSDQQFLERTRGAGVARQDGAVVVWTDQFSSVTSVLR